MQIDENKDVIRRWSEARNRGDIEAALACWVDEAHARLRANFNGFSKGFPDVQVNIDEMIGEGGKVVVRWTMTGTHRGVWSGIPATGNVVQWNGTDIYTIANGRITALVRGADSVALLKQLGAVVTWQDKVI